MFSFLQLPHKTSTTAYLLAVCPLLRTLSRKPSSHLSYTKILLSSGRTFCCDCFVRFVNIHISEEVGDEGEGRMMEQWLYLMAQFLVQSFAGLLASSTGKPSCFAPVDGLVESPIGKTSTFVSFVEFEVGAVLTASCSAPSIGFGCLLLAEPLVSYRLVGFQRHALAQFRASARSFNSRCLLVPQLPDSHLLSDCCSYLVTQLLV